MKHEIEFCWRCGGCQSIQCSTAERSSGYKPCPECKGTGCGESLETYWKRMGITPDRREDQRASGRTIIEWI